MVKLTDTSFNKHWLDWVSLARRTFNLRETGTYSQKSFGDQSGKRNIATEKWAKLSDSWAWK